MDRLTLRMTLVLALAASGAFADALLVRAKGGKLSVEGMPDKIEEEPVTIANWKVYVTQSTGVIGRDGYDGVELLKKAGDKKGTFFPADQIVEKIFTTQPDSLLEAYDVFARGNFSQAISAYRSVAESAEAPEVYRLEALFNVGICYLQMGNVKAAQAHYAKWPGQNSTYTPEVHRILAEIHTDQKGFDKAREAYGQIGALPDLPKYWKFKARLGPVKVDIAERKFDQAEATAKSIAGEIGMDESLVDARALALLLQAQAIFESGNKARLPEAQKILEGASDLAGVASDNRAAILANLGHAIYAQGKPEEAIFPYMRVVCLYPGESAQVAGALQNAGQCFLDMAGRVKNDQPASDGHLVNGMKLLAECATRYKGTAAASAAGSSYMKSKAAYEEALARRGGDGSGTAGGEGTEGGK